MAFYQEFRYCKVPIAPYVGNNICDNYGLYNTKACAFDGGDCDKFNKSYPKCKAPNGTKVGDGICDNYDVYNTKLCGFDGGDCKDFNNKYPGFDCRAPHPDLLGDGICNGGEYNTEPCAFDQDDCKEFNEKYPGCEANEPWIVGDGTCHMNPMRYDMMTEECKWDGGDCDGELPADIDIAKNIEDLSIAYPDCDIGFFAWVIGNGDCDHKIFNIEECGYDGGDCTEFNEKYPNCEVAWPVNIGDGECDGSSIYYNTISLYDTPECGYDGGDCDKFRQEYPDCDVLRPALLGDGFCHGGAYNTEVCGFDGGDCVNITMPFDAFPDCKVDRAWKVGDGVCDGDNINVKECGYDGGDCEEFNAQYPGCFPWDPHKLGDGVCDEEYNTLECKLDGGDCDGTPKLFQYGEAVSIEDYKTDTKIFSAVQSSFSMISLFGSIAILIMICRSHRGLSTTINRLLLGLCVSDILSSSFQCLATVPAPREFADVIWNARGSVASCEAQGFFIFVGSIASPLYNCSLCFYYLIVLKYSKTENFIRGKIEPFLHGVPVLFSLIGGFILLGLKAFNPNMTYCFIGPDPTCDDKDCDRVKDTMALFILFSAAPYIFLPGVIITTMTITYRTVSTQEKKLLKKGIGAVLKDLRKKVDDAKKKRESEDANIGTSHPANSSSIKDFLRNTFKLPSSETKEANRSLRKRNRMSRAVFNTAVRYSIAFLLSYTLPMVISIRTLCNLKSGFTLSILARIFFPLQGFFNFCVFIFPILLAVKNENVGWFAAFAKALRYRGAKRTVSRSLKSGGQRLRSLRYWIARLSMRLSVLTSRFLSTSSSSKSNASPSNTGLRDKNNDNPFSVPLQSNEDLEV